MNDGIAFLSTYRGKYTIIVLTGACALMMEIFYQYVLKSTFSTQTTLVMATVGGLIISSIGEADKERLAWKAATRIFLMCLLYTIAFMSIGGIIEASLLGELSDDDPKKNSVQVLFAMPPLIFTLTACFYCLSTGGYLLLKRIGL